MRIESTHIPYLRLVRPSEVTQKADTPAQPDRSGPTGRGFGAIYNSGVPNLPKLDLSPSQKSRLEILRNRLVAATTDVPIHFDQPTPRLKSGQNVAAQAYLRFPTDPAERNANATGAVSERDA